MCAWGRHCGGASLGFQDFLQLAASFEAFEGNVRCKPGSARFGRIIIGNSDAGVAACSDSAVNPAHWPGALDGERVVGARGLSRLRTLLLRQRRDLGSRQRLDAANRAASSADLGVEEYLDIICRARADEPAGPG